MSRRIRIGVVGCGKMGSIHTANLHQQPEVSISALYDPRREWAERLNHRLGLNAVLCNSLEEVFDRTFAVVVATSPDKIADVAETAAIAGKHIFCEKPPGLSLEEAGRIESSVRGAGITCDFDFQYDLDPAAQHIGELLHQGQLGAVSMVSFSHHNEDDTGDPEQARKIIARLHKETPFLDSGIHRTRQVERWFGPGEIKATGGCAIRTNPALPGPNVQSGWMITRHEGSQVMTFLDITWFAPGARKSRRDFNLDSPIHPYWILIGTNRSLAGIMWRGQELCPRPWSLTAIYLNTFEW